MIGDPETHWPNPTPTTPVEDETSPNWKLEKGVCQMFRMEIRAKVLGDDIYFNTMKAAMNSQTPEHVETLKYNYLMVADVDEDTRAEALARLANDVGYFAGYYDLETRLRVERLYNTYHPILGLALEKPDWTDAELLQKARWWNHLWEEDKREAIRLRDEENRKIEDVDRRIKLEKLDAEKGHHSNKVRRRNKKGLKSEMEKANGKDNII